MDGDRITVGNLSERLAHEFARGLPGRAAQSLFEPELSYGRHFGPPAADARAATVLVLCYPDVDHWHLPLTVRPATMDVHAGQISLPGGRVEPDETSQQAVLRELEEELGVLGSDVELLGALSPLYLFASNFLVMPWVAWCERRPRLKPDSREVAEVLELPLGQLLSPASRGIHSRRHCGVSLSAPHFQWGRHRIWGATAMILSEFAAVVARSFAPSSHWHAPTGVEAGGPSG